MAERSRGKRRKQANPRRNQGDIERCLGSEGEDEGSVWGMEVLDSRDGQDKISLTPSEGTEPGSPAPCVRSQSLSPPGESWGETETTPLKITAGDPEHSENSMYSQRDVGVLENASHYDSMVQLRKVSHLLSPLHGQQRNGSMASYHLGGVHDDMSLVSWSPGEHESPEGKDGVPLNSDAPRIQVQACPFCQRTYRRDASLREHMKFCQEREGGDNICPLCGYSTPYRAQMERHLTLHSQTQEKNPMSDPTMENRKFKCNQCGKAFKYKHHLKEHLRIHSGEKPYECSNCKKRFSHSGSYSSHLSSKKCLSGGGAGNGAHFNGHSHSAYLFPSPVSPPVVGGRNGSRGKSSPYPPLGQFPTDQLAHTGQDSAVPVLHALELSRSWDPAADLAMRTGVFKGTTLLPLLQSRSKFEHLLQEMLRREVGRDEERASRDGGEEKGGRERKVETQIGAISCRWCSQLFPSEAILAHHERYQCRTRDGVNIPPSPRHRDGSPLNFSRASHLPYDTQTSPTANNVPFRDISSPQRASWHSVPQQLLVPLPTPVQIPQDPTHKHWPNEGTVSPRKPNAIDPTSPTIPERQHLISSRFGSPPCLDLSINTTSPRQPVRHNSGSAGIQNEPLDLSIPKPHSARPREARDQTCNGYSPHQERRDPEGVFKRLTPPSQQQVGRAYEAAPLFGSTVFSNYPLFNHIIPGSLAGMGHNGLTSLPLTPTPSPGFLSPVAYMLEAESESMLKRMQHDRHSIMGEAMSRGGIDYLSLMEEGMDGEMGPGRKRLKKTEEGLYACDICDKTFQKSSSLLRHKYEHTGKRPHECQICKKAFKHKHHLIEHSRLHSGEKPYQCDKCGKRFSHSGSYSQHMNHRYAFCSRDNDPDGPGEDPALGDVVPYLSPVMERDPGAEVPAPTLEDSATYLSDSSLEGAALEYREEEQDEEEDESSLSNHVHDRVMVERAMMKESRVTPEHLKEETEDGTLEEGAEVEGQDVEENHQENLVKAEQDEERERTNETNIERE